MNHVEHLLMNKCKNMYKCVLTSDQECDIQPTLINLHPNKYSQEFHYYPILSVFL